MKVGGIMDTSTHYAEKPNRFTMEQRERRLIVNILIDIRNSKIEGWDYKEYINELKQIIDALAERI